ncbi:MAG: 3-dehydroquinate synthase [Acidobacteriota bacterium]
MTRREIALRLDGPGAEPTTRILVGDDLLGDSEVVERVAPWLAERTLFFMSSGRILGLHGRRLAPLLAAGARAVELEVPDGEAAKSLDVAGSLWATMLSRGGKRDSRMLAFGGGSVGDLAGFVAGAFLRGIAFAQVPTTLLAQVDASVGGKTGLDLPRGKNTVGLFHHPPWVLADTSVLGTLPREELRSGLVEVVKMAAFLDLDLLARVERDLEAILAAEPAVLVPVVAAAVAAKTAVVEEDATEGGRRRILNFGHTLGHAIEARLGYSGLRHGEAVAYGMLFALRLAERRGSVDAGIAGRLRDLLGRFDLPTLPVSIEDAEALVDLARGDKKATERGLVWILPSAPGDSPFVSDLGDEVVLDELRRFLEDPSGRP